MKNKLEALRRLRNGESITVDELLDGVAALMNMPEEKDGKNEINKK